MALDSAQKRLAAISPMCPWRGVGALPSGTVTAAERAAVVLLYSGLFDDGGGGPPPPGTGSGDDALERIIHRLRLLWNHF